MTSHEYAPTLDKGAADGPRRNQDAAYVAVSRALTQGERYDGDTETFIADTLTSGSHPASNMPGRRREDDTNIVQAFDWQQGSRDVRLHDQAEHYRKDGQPAALTPEGVRRLTPVECERLQGFPDGWTAHGPDSRRYAALGDAVTVNVAQWIGERLLRYG